MHNNKWWHCKDSRIYKSVKNINQWVFKCWCSGLLEGFFFPQISAYYNLHFQSDWEHKNTFHSDIGSSHAKVETGEKSLIHCWDTTCFCAPAERRGLQAHNFLPQCSLLLAIGSSGWRRQVRPLFFNWQLSFQWRTRHKFWMLWPLQQGNNSTRRTTFSRHGPSRHYCLKYSEVATCVKSRQKKKSQSSVRNLKERFLLSNSICAARGSSLAD